MRKHIGLLFVLLLAASLFSSCGNVTLGENEADKVYHQDDSAGDNTEDTEQKLEEKKEVEENDKANTGDASEENEQDDENKLVIKIVTTEICIGNHDSILYDGDNEDIVKEEIINILDAEYHEGMDLQWDDADADRNAREFVKAVVDEYVAGNKE